MTGIDYAIAGLLASFVFVPLLGTLIVRRRLYGPQRAAPQPTPARWLETPTLDRPCPSCKARVGVLDTLCANCGASLPARRLLCPKCGLKASGTTRFCTRCRTQLAS
jgi:hypothetical protein